MIAEVIGWKFNNQAGMKTIDGKIVEFPGGIPSQEDQDSWTTEYNNYIATQEYKKAREAGYKELKEQLDLLYHDMVADKGDKTGEWFKHIKAVKDANPKG